MPLPSGQIEVAPQAIDQGVVDPIGAAAPPTALPTVDRVGRAALTWVAGLIYTLVTIIAGFFATPYLLRFLNDQRYGAFRASSDWLGYLNLLSLGLGNAVGVMMLKARAKGDGEAFASLTKLGMRVYAYIALATLPIGVVLAWMMPRLVRIEAPMIGELRWCAMIGLLGYMLMPLHVFRSVLESAQRGYVVSFALLAQAMLTTAVAILLAWRGWGLVGQAIAVLAGTALLYVSMTQFAVRNLGWAHVKPASVPLGRLWTLAWPLALAGLGNRLNLMTDTIVVGMMLGSTQVTSLFLTQRIVALAGSQINSLANASWAGLAEVKEREDHAVFQDRVIEVSRLVVGMGITLLGTVAAYNRHFVTAWVGQSIYGGDALTLITMAACITFGFLVLFSWLIDSQGDTRHRLWVSTAGSVLNLGLSIFFVHLIGIPGVALGTLAAYLLTDAWYCPMVVCRRYHVRAAVLIGSLARGMATGLPWAIAIWFFAHGHTPRGRWSGLLLEMSATGVASLAYCWLLVLTPAERARWRLRIAARLHRDRTSAA